MRRRMSGARIGKSVAKDCERLWLPGMRARTASGWRESTAWTTGTKMGASLMRPKTNILLGPVFGGRSRPYDGVVAEAKRVLAVLPRFREENSGMERWLPMGFPAGPDKAIVYPDPFDCARLGMDFERSAFEIIDGVEAVR